MEYYILTITLISHISSKKYRKLSFFGILATAVIFHVFCFLSLLMISTLEVEPINSIMIALATSIILTITSTRPPINSERWLWSKNILTLDTNSLKDK
ncbi:MAG: hypothetical protein DRI86_00980 [Bacteroidetes bacterium]|nr:MAG: hypothetical protein DRI86_00980 [Bacteroidota bacterium]